MKLSDWVRFCKERLLDLRNPHNVSPEDRVERESSKPTKLNAAFARPPPRPHSQDPSGTLFDRLRIVFGQFQYGKTGNRQTPVSQSLLHYLLACNTLSCLIMCSHVVAQLTRHPGCLTFSLFLTSRSSQISSLEAQLYLTRPLPFFLVRIDTLQYAKSYPKHTRDSGHAVPDLGK